MRTVIGSSFNPRSTPEVPSSTRHVCCATPPDSPPCGGGRVGVEAHPLDNANLFLVRALPCWATDNLPGALDAATEGVRHGRAARATNWDQINLVRLGFAHLFADNRIQAEGLLFRAARLALDDGNTLQPGVALQRLSALAAADNHPTAAALLLGASTTLVPFWPLMARRFGPLLDRGRDELGDRFDAEFEAGNLLAPDEAVALALDPSSVERRRRSNRPTID